MAGYAVHAARMDAEVDERLGDDVELKTRGVAVFTTIKAFLYFDEPEESPAPRDSSKGKATLKISKAHGRPHLDWRIKSPLLGGSEWRPIGKDVATAGRYWVTDLQPV